MWAACQEGPEGERGALFHSGMRLVVRTRVRAALSLARTQLVCLAVLRIASLDGGLIEASSPDILTLSDSRTGHGRRLPECDCRFSLGAVAGYEKNASSFEVATWPARHWPRMHDPNEGRIACLRWRGLSRQLPAVLATLDPWRP